MTDQVAPARPDTQAPDDAAPSTRGLLYRLGAFCARHARLVVIVWLVLAAALVAADRSFGGTYVDDFSLPGTSFQKGLDLIKAHQPTGGNGSRIVLRAGSGTLAAHRDAIEQTVADLKTLPHVLAVSDPLTTPGAVAADGRTGLVTVSFAGNPVTYDAPYLTGVDSAVAPARAAGLSVDYDGQLGQLARPKPNDRRSEIIGLAVALAVLLLGFGSVAAAGLPLLSALVGVASGLSVLGLIAASVSFAAVSPTLAIMMALGVGIDYALFLGTRFRKVIADGADPVDAAGSTTASSGRAVMVAALTVTIALLGLYASGIDFIGRLGLAAGLAIVVSALAALTLTPALLGLAGRKIDRWRVRTPVSEPSGQADLWSRYALLVGRRRWLFLLGGLAVALVLAVPTLSMNLGHVGAGANPAGYTDRRAFDTIASAFGPGANAPLTIVVSVPQGTTAQARTALGGSLRAALSATDGVAAVTPFAASRDGAVLIGTVTPTTDPQNPATTRLINRLEDTTLPAAVRATGAAAYVTGPTAAQAQFRHTLSARLPLIISIVVGAAFLLLLVVFRGLLVALKAAVLNLLSIAASYGVLVAVFQWGWGSSLIGVVQKVPIESYVPTMMFAIVFGLSMDYEIFLLSRIRETWLSTSDNRGSVAAGLSATGRVITCAALIMTSVFAAFLLSTNVVVKMLALGLAVSVILDATLIRLVLVPATMYLLGRANWWLPRRLDRVLPHVDAEG